MKITEKMNALRRLPVFQGVDEFELLLIADAASVRTYSPGAAVCRAGECPARLYIVLSGLARFADGAECGAIFDLAALLYDRALREDIVAAEQTLVCLTISKGHFFTLVNECPRVLVNALQEVPLSTDLQFHEGDNAA